MSISELEEPSSVHKTKLVAPYQNLLAGILGDIDVLADEMSDVYEFPPNDRPVSCNADQMPDVLE